MATAAYTVGVQYESTRVRHGIVQLCHSCEPGVREGARPAPGLNATSLAARADSEWSVGTDPIHLAKMEVAEECMRASRRVIASLPRWWQADTLRASAHIIESPFAAHATCLGGERPAFARKSSGAASVIRLQLR